MPAGDGGLGEQLVGEKIAVGKRNMHVTKLLGEGGFSYVYAVKELDGGSGSSTGNGEEPTSRKEKPLLVLKVTSIHSRAQRDIAEKEAKLLSRLSHPSIIKMHDTCYRQVVHSSGTLPKRKDAPPTKERPQHLILMEYCEGGHALDVCSQLAAAGKRFDLSTLIIAFGQICNAVSYLHAQRPPIVHRDLKPVNFLVKNGAYKLCDFGSAVFGHVDLRTSKARAEAEEVIEKTTTQMFRSPEMVDLYMAKKLTQATDVWALGCCLYSLAFLQNCFEEGSNLAILSRKYTIPEDNPYGDGLAELLDRMLTVDCKARADMTEVILCLSAVYSGRPLPPRKKSSRASKSESKTEEIGNFRTDGQGIQQKVYDPTKATEGKKLASNSVAARRKRAAASSAGLPPPGAAAAPAPAVAGGAFPAFSSDSKDGNTFDGGDAAFGEMKGFDSKDGDASNDFFGSFASSGKEPAASAGGNDAFDAAFDTGAWGGGESGAAGQEQAQDVDGMPAPGSQDASDGGPTDGDDKRKDRTRRRRAGQNSRSTGKGGELEGGMDAMNINEGVDGEKKERRSRASRADREDEHRRRRSGSRSRRKRPSARSNGAVPPAEVLQGEGDKKSAGKKPGFGRMFNRKPTPPPEP